MREKTNILVIVGITLLVRTSAAKSQEEQWLRYHSAREAHRIMPDMGSSAKNATADKPQGVDLPQFKSQQPLFVRWGTPMAESGGLWIALDHSSKGGKPDLLYIDSNGNGHLDDEKATKAYLVDQNYTYFGPVKVVFEVEDGPVVYHLNFRFFDYNESNRRLYIYSGGWYEGEITVAGRQKYCVLIDHNANGTFDDKSVESSKCDRIMVGKKGTRATGWVGDYIEIDGVFYSVELARDGAFIKLATAKGLKFGNIRVPETISELSAGGRNGLFVFEPAKGTGRLPVGEYRIDHWEIDRKDDKGRNWTLRGSSFGNRGNFEITEGSETSLEIGEPVTGRLSVRLAGGSYEFSKSLRGSLGEYVTLSSSGRDVGNLWRMRGKNKEGTFEKLYAIPDQ